jgi:hypothetical protein
MENVMAIQAIQIPQKNQRSPRIELDTNYA